MGKSIVVDVEYEWKPLACLKCGTFGHKCRSPDKESAPNQPIDGTKDAEPAQVNNDAGSQLEKGKEVTYPPASGREDFVAIEDPQPGIRSTHIGESNSPEGNSLNLQEPSASQPANCSIAESESELGDMGWKQVKRKNKKKKKKAAK